MAEENKLQHILDKLRKLMNLKESAIQCGETGEANAAAAGITRLLKEYDLTMQDIPDSLKPSDPVDIEAIPYKFPYMQYHWYWDLLNTIAYFNGADIIQTTEYSGKKVSCTYYRVIGRRKNREIVLYLISFLVHQFIAIGKRNYPKWKLDYIYRTGQTPPVQGIYMKSFLSGCNLGLYDKLKSESDTLPQEKLTALVKADRTALDAFMADMNIKKSRQKDETLMDDVSRDGFITGRNISIHKGVGGRTGPVDLIGQE